MNRRTFFKLMGAIPFMGPFLTQLANDPSRLEKLREIAMRIMHAPTRTTVDIITNFKRLG